MMEVDYYNLDDVKIDSNEIIIHRQNNHNDHDFTEPNGFDLVLAGGLSLWCPSSIVILLWWLQHNGKINTEPFPLIGLSVITIFWGNAICVMLFMYFIFALRKVFAYFFPNAYDVLVDSCADLQNWRYAVSFLINYVIIYVQILFIKNVSAETSAFLIISNILLFPHVLFVFYAIITLFSHKISRI